MEVRLDGFGSDAQKPPSFALASYGRAGWTYVDFGVMPSNH